jgi:D-alanine-D-alanine ligase
MKKRVAVLMGGWGEEREISLKTGEGVVKALRALGHVPLPVVAGPELDRELREARPEVAFLALHGRMGEDGRVQGLLEVMGLPYTGSGVLASALAMDKAVAKRLFAFHNLPAPCGYTVGEPGMAGIAHGDLGFPVVVKPARGGSSIGLSVVFEEEALPRAIEQAARYGGQALVERRVEGREVTVAILGDQVLGSLEIAYPGQVFDFDRKYRAGASHFLPPRLGRTRRANVESLALGAYRALGCRGYGRVDLICAESENDLLLEVNTLPGLTPVSLFPKIARAAGLSFEALVGELLARAGLDQEHPAPVRAAA